ncbi:MAG: amidohydrolase [Ruminococcaceae bacterium]|nr:amidohydrolase [Oscillospiraceae bacterium]
MKILLKNATLLPEYGYGNALVHVLVKDKKIKEIYTELPSELTVNETVDCGGNLLIPAFYNAHCHAAMTLFRGFGEDLPLKRWLEEKIFPAEERLTFRSVYHATMLAIAEMLKSGIACFSDMYMFEDAVAEAVLATGIKANVSRSLVSFDPEIEMGKESRMIEAIRLAEWYHGIDDGRILVDFSLHAEYTNVPKACAYVADIARRFQTGMQIHLSETENEHNECIGRWGKTPTEFFRDTGVLELPTTAAHGVYLTESDVAILAEKKASVAHNPVSNLKLGSGVMPIRRLIDGGVNVALGTDGVASNNRLDMLRELQTAAILHKGVNRDPEAIKAPEAFKLATLNGAIAQRRFDCGVIRVGNRADLVLLDRTSLHNMPNYDDYAMIAYSAERSDVRMTMVDGRILYRNGEYTSIDEERLRHDCRETFAHYFD